MLRMKQIRFIELFAGVGGFRYGLENVTASKGKQSLAISMGTQQFTCVYANEWDKYAAQIYRRHYGEIDTRDIRDVSEFPDFDLLTAGFPCQAFSVAGKRLGFEDTRGTLFFEIARILKSKRPRHLLLENVKGLLSHEQGKTFNTILGILTDLGYRVEWMVLNSKHFGVPQNRERVFIIGHSRNECTGQVFPVIGNGGENSIGVLRATYYKGWQTRGPMLKEITPPGTMQGYRVYGTEGISQTLASEAGGMGAKTGLYAIKKNDGKIIQTKDEALNLDKNYHKGLDNHGQRTGVLCAMRGREHGQQLEPRGDETNSLTSVAKDNLWIENARIRRLTPTECARLQGFLDKWAEFGMLEDGTIVKISDSQQYKCYGNAITTNVVQAIGEGLLKHIEEQR